MAVHTVFPQPQLQSTGDFPGDLSALEFQTEYRSIKDDPVGGFYHPCLRNSSYYRRAVGYFRSTVFLVVGPPVIEFARRGGRIDLICSPDLDPTDVEQIATGYASRNEAVSETLIAEFDRLLADPETAAPARTLATLIALGTLELKLAARADGRGIYHEKLGVFSDTRGNVVTFKGSSNETWSGWHRFGNFESIEVFCSWRGGLETERVERHRKHFDHLWSENDPHVLVRAFPSSATEYFKKYALKGLDALTVDAASPASRRRSALPHQDAAIAGWRDQNCQGILQHATGSGKTFTAVLAIRAHVERGLPTLVVVPSRLLLEQWKLELLDEVPGTALLLAGAGHDRWRTPRRLEGMTTSDTSLGARIVLSTMQTASTQEFRARVMGGEHLLLVADEVHQVGSTQNSQLMTIAAGARLGLSATPTRYGDPEGTARILDYFGGVVPPPITLLDAIENGRLVPYEYHPHPVHLTATEASEWKDLTKAVRQEIARGAPGSEGRGPLSDRAKMLLIKRSRIAKKAAVKVRLAVQVLAAAHQPGQSWLVYCEDGGQLTDILISLRGAGLPCAEYHSGMSGDRDATMAWFRAYGGILVSIRCLDEGVDIPSVSHALILASSQNPRQFIQRRGRVLRRAEGKEIAVIHDAIVVPADVDTESDQMGLLRAELLRSIEFANHALNRSGGAELREIAVNMGLDPDSLSGTEGEEDDDGQ